MDFFLTATLNSTNFRRCCLFLSLSILSIHDLQRRTSPYCCALRNASKCLLPDCLYQLNKPRRPVIRYSSLHESLYSSFQLHVRRNGNSQIICGHNDILRAPNSVDDIVDSLNKAQHKVQLPQIRARVIPLRHNSTAVNNTNSSYGQTD